MHSVTQADFLYTSNHTEPMFKKLGDSCLLYFEQEFFCSSEDSCIYRFIVQGLIIIIKYGFTSCHMFFHVLYVKQTSNQWNSLVIRILGPDRVWISPTLHHQQLIQPPPNFLVSSCVSHKYQQYLHHLGCFGIEWFNKYEALGTLSSRE